MEMQRQQQVEFKEEITSQMGCKWGLGTSWRPLGAVCEKSNSQERFQEDIEHKNASRGSPMTSKMTPKSKQNSIFFQSGPCVPESVQKHANPQKKGPILEDFLRVKMRSDFFLELYLLLPLRLLLKNAP
jgi:hypothetical protein